MRPVFDPTTFDTPSVSPIVRLNDEIPTFISPAEGGVSPLIKVFELHLILMHFHQLDYDLQ